MRLTTQWIIGLALAALPFVVLTLAGIFALWEYGLLWAWLVLAGVLSLAGWLWVERLKRQRVTARPLAMKPGIWDETGKNAWQQVERIAETTPVSSIPLDRWDGLWKLLREIMETVARCYHPNSQEALWEMPVPYLLKVIELAARDLREAFSENIPGSHILTISDILRGQRLASLGSELYNLYRILSLAANPTSALLREVRGAFTGKLLDASGEEIKTWLLQAYIKKVGYYAIELYSGHLVLDELALKQYQTHTSKKNTQTVQQRDTHLEREPLRVLVLGQVKAGKSSLINALFGETKALTGVLPQTSRVTPYLLEREGLERAIILDTAGYEDQENPSRPLEEVQQEILRCDLVLLVCAATTAARQADRLLLESTRRLFQTTGKEFPPIMVVLTHIDQLRPLREWNPPYDVANPTHLKAQNIRQALESVAQDVGVDLSQVVPVYLQPGAWYNVEEGLIPAIWQQFDATQRMKYLRCLKELKDNDYWQRLWEQAQNTGKVVVKSSLHLAGKLGRQLDVMSQTWLKP